MILPLEDAFSDILSKAQKGLGITTEALAERCQVSESEIRAARRGDFDPLVVAKLADAMELNTPAVLQIGKGEWRPTEVSQMEELRLVCSPFYDWQVNAFLLVDKARGKAIAFDTGTDAKPMIELLDAEGLELERIYLTHAHPDHIKGVPALQARWPKADALLGSQEGGAVRFPVQRIEPPFSEAWGALEISCLETPGHTAGGLSFVVNGLDRPLAFVGDALFAGSMGGANVSYDAGLASIDRLLGLPEETILAPGHGPLTSVAEERRMNAFAR